MHRDISLWTDRQLQPYLRRMLVVRSINCVVKLCSSVDFRDWVSCLALDTLGKNADYADAAFARLSAVLMA